jgi:hypothetical protein
MLTINSGLFVRIPGESQQRILHPATLIEANDATFTAETEEDDLTFEAGQEILVYFEYRREFMQQTARIDAVMQSDDAKPVIGFQLLGDAVSAESRQCYRVSTALMNLFATLGADGQCPVLDVSFTGFSVLATGCYDEGEVVDAVLQFENEKFRGRARIQSITQMSPGVRYGLHCISDNKVGGDLERGLRHIAMAVQHEQLRRRARQA